jgi:quercetin dioxygenase-like cupin family protein
MDGSQGSESISRRVARLAAAATPSARDRFESALPRFDSSEVISTEILSAGQGGLAPFRAHTETTYLVLDGLLEVQIDRQPRTLRKGELLRVPPGTAHTFRSADQRLVRFLSIVPR